MKRGRESSRALKGQRVCPVRECKVGQSTRQPVKKQRKISGWHPGIEKSTSIKESDGEEYQMT